MTKAIEEGYRDAETWLYETPSEDWADAIKPGVLGADEALINALGATKAAEWLGVTAAYDADGNLTQEAGKAFAAYSKAWAEHVAKAVGRLGDDSDVCVTCGAIEKTDAPGPEFVCSKCRIVEESHA